MARRRRRTHRIDIRFRHVMGVALVAGLVSLTQPIESMPRLRIGVVAVLWLLVYFGLRWWLLVVWVRFLHGFLSHPGRVRQWLFGWLKFRKSIHFTKNVKANFTQNGLASTSGRDGSLTTNSVRGTRAQAPGPFFIQRTRNRIGQKPEGDVASLPRLRWQLVGYADEPADEYGPFPMYAVKWNGYTALKRRCPGKKRSYLYEVEEAENAHFRTLPELLEALGGWEPVVGMSKNGAEQ
jgi:hypothetical protein